MPKNNKKLLMSISKFWMDFCVPLVYEWEKVHHNIKEMFLHMCAWRSHLLINSQHNSTCTNLYSGKHACHENYWRCCNQNVPL